MINEAVAGAIDIGGTKIAVGIVDSEGRVRTRAETPTAPEQGYPAALRRMTTMLRDAISQSGGRMNGIGIGATGPIDPAAGVFGDVGNLPGWKGAPLAADLAGEFEVPVVMENDADAAALGEATWGAGRGKKSFIYVTISTGIGAGVVLDGRLYRGAGGAHPEIGHQVIDTSGPTCYCRAQGCWESVASGPAMEAWFRASKGEELPAKRICELARECDPVAVQAVEREARYLGLGLANLVTIFCPETIALGGGLMQSADLFLPKALEVVRNICTQVPLENTSIVTVAPDRDAGLVGAACVWLHRL